MFSIFLASAAVAAQPTPQEPNWAWDCSSASTLSDNMGTVGASIQLDKDGKITRTKVEWEKGSINGSGPAITADWTIETSDPKKLVSGLMFVRPSADDWKKIGKRKFIWRVDIEKNPNDAIFYLHEGQFATDKLRPEKWFADSMTTSSNTLFAFARGAESLYFIAQDAKTGEILLSEDLQPQKWALVEQTAHELVERVVAKSKNQFTQCTRFDDTPEIVV